jgi:hypothetical protein
VYSSSPSRSQFIRDLLIGVSDRYPAKEVFLRPILDGLVLFKGSPHCLSFFTAGKNPRLLYTTLEDSELQPRFLDQIRAEVSEGRTLRNMPKTAISVAVHEIKTVGRVGNLPNISFQQVDATAVCRLLSLLDHEPSHLGKPVFKAVCDYLDGRENSSQSAESISLLSREDYENRGNVLRTFVATSFWKRLRSVVDDAFGSVEHASLLTSLNGKNTSLFNLFCVARTATNLERRRSFDYTAQVVLSTLQITQIQDDQLAAQIQTPLGPSARSIADSVFCSGVIDFSDEVAGKGRDLAGDSIADGLRHSAEENVYKRITAQPNTFYIPVHVSGVPWLALFTLSPRPSVGSNAAYTWSHNYHIYREVVPKVADIIRRGTRRVYLEFLAMTLRDHFGTRELRLFIAKVNAAWAQLTYLLPFPQATLTLEYLPGSKRLSLPTGAVVWLSLEDENRNFVRQLPYDLLTCNEVTLACDAAVKTEMHQIAVITEQDHARAQFLRHTMINHFPLTSLEAALAQPDSELCGTARQHVEDARKLSGMVNVALAFVTRARPDDAYPLEGLGVAGILRWLEQQRLDCEALPCVTIDGIADWIPQRDDLPEAFTVLLNLWENAGKHSPKDFKEFTVKLTRSSGYTVLAIANRGVMPVEWRNFLLGIAESPNRSSVRKGLEIALGGMNRLGWRVATISTEANTTRIEVHIPLTSELEANT